jgi:hypothetical protein
MELLLDRTSRTLESTIGVLYVDGKHECFVLEDTDRGLQQYMPLDQIMRLKVKGKTAIPAGRYEVLITYSNRFKQQMPVLVNVPGYEGIRIHPGNTAADTEGCLLPGLNKSVNTVTASKKAYSNFYIKLDAALKKQKVYITIK